MRIQQWPKKKRQKTNMQFEYCDLRKEKFCFSKKTYGAEKFLLNFFDGIAVILQQVHVLVFDEICFWRLHLFE